MFTVNVGNLYRWNGSPLVLFHGENLVHLLLQVLVSLLCAEWSAQPYYGCTGEETNVTIILHILKQFADPDQGSGAILTPGSGMD